MATDRSVDFQEAQRQLEPMDTIKILLTMTVALLLGALAMSWKNFRRDARQEDPKELAAVQREIAEIERQRDQLRQERERWLGGGTTAPEVSPVPDAAVPPGPEIAELPEGLLPEGGAVFEDEMVPEPPVPQPPPVSAAGADERAKKIAAAPAVAKVQEWVESPELGSFATIDIVDPAVVKADTVLCIRRGSGILGRVKVSEVAAEGALANALTVFNDVKPVKGDDLIVEP
jgi:hypothetical protein